jgi:hypothetical protein
MTDSFYKVIAHRSRARYSRCVSTYPPPNGTATEDPVLKISRRAFLERTAAGMAVGLAGAPPARAQGPSVPPDELRVLGRCQTKPWGRTE